MGEIGPGGPVVGRKVRRQNYDVTSTSAVPARNLCAKAHRSCRGGWQRADNSVHSANGSVLVATAFNQESTMTKKRFAAGAGAEAVTVWQYRYVALQAIQIQREVCVKGGCTLLHGGNAVPLINMR